MSLTSEAIWAAAPSTTRGSPTIISSDSKGERIAYASNKSIFVRSIDRPELSKQYTQHTAQTTVARFSPSGFYIASGDVSGTVRVWDSTTADITKGEYHIVAGRINDVAWDGDSQRIIAVGDGKERFGHCITADSGNSVGTITGHSAPINCVSIRQQRPLRAATGSDDLSLGFFHGAPFKFNTSVRNKHERYIYGTAFSPDGNHLVSVGSDRKIWLYDGKTGEPSRQIGEGEHKGSIFGVSWAADSSKFVTCSADQTVKIWEVSSGKCLQSWRLGDEGVVNIMHHQVGVTWPPGRSDGLIISLDLAGNLTYLCEGKEQPIRVIYGHQKAINADGSAENGKKIWTGDSDGVVCAWDTNTGLARAIDGEKHSNYVSGVSSPSATSRIYTVGWDDSLRSIDQAQDSFVGSVIKTEGQPRGVASAGTAGKTYSIVASTQGVTVYADEDQTSKTPLSAVPTAIAASKDVVAVGSEDNKVYIFQLSGTGQLSQIAVLEDATSPVSTLAVSPDASHVAAGLTNGKIFSWSKTSGSWTLETNRWSAHTARVTRIAWSPDSSNAVSGGLDTNVYVWSLTDPGKRIKAANAHKEGVSGVSWLDNDRVLSAGADAALKVWKVDGLR